MCIRDSFSHRGGVALLPGATDREMRRSSARVSVGVTENCGEHTIFIHRRRFSTRAAWSRETSAYSSRVVGYSLDLLRQHRTLAFAEQRVPPSFSRRRTRSGCSECVCMNVNCWCPRLLPSHDHHPRIFDLYTNRNVHLFVSRDHVARVENLRGRMFAEFPAAFSPKYQG